MHPAHAQRRGLREGGEKVRAFLIMVKREMEDHSFLYAGAAIVVVFYIVYAATKILAESPSPPRIGVPPIMYTLLLNLLPWLAVAAAGVGAVQMRSDLRANTCTFLSTMATTRRRVLGAKLLAGLIWILVLAVPMALTDLVLLAISPRVIRPDLGLLARMLGVFVLACASGYAIGLDVGLGEKKLVAVFAILVLVPLLLSVILIKGFGAATAAVLGLVAVACLVRAWTRFMTNPL
jgi:uncharacterized membrane protein YozB (DUF420 family)